MKITNHVGTCRAIHLISTSQTAKQPHNDRFTPELMPAVCTTLSELSVVCPVTCELGKAAALCAGSGSGVSGLMSASSRAVVLSDAIFAPP